MGHPLRSDQEASANGAFDALMWALSRPGHIRTLPAPGVTGIVDALIDGECRVWAEDPAVEHSARRAGAELASVDVADHVFAGSGDVAGLIARLAVGSDLHPEGGATLVLPARLEQGAGLRLSGPGVDGTVEIAVDDVPEAAWAARAAVSRYPKGFEMFLIDGDRVLGLPRSTRVELI